MDDKENNEPFNYYNKDEIRQILENKEHLVFVDDGMDEVIIRYEDIPDFIIDVNRRICMCDLKFYEYEGYTMQPIISCYGEFLNKCDLKVREDIIDRLVALQTNEAEVKDYKIMDEYMVEAVAYELEKSETQTDKVTKIKEEYPVGTKIRLNYMENENTVPNGTIGIVNHVDDIGQIHVNWENGSTLSVIPDIDLFDKVEMKTKAKYYSKDISEYKYNSQIVDVLEHHKGKTKSDDRYTVQFNDGTIKEDVTINQLRFDYQNKKGDRNVR